MPQAASTCRVILPCKSLPRAIFFVNAVENWLFVNELSDKFCLCKTCSEVCINYYLPIAKDFASLFTVYIQK